MNQILDYNPNNSSKNSGGSDKVVRVFAIILIIFAVAVIAVVGFGMINNKNGVINEAEQETFANIEVVKGDTTATIKVTHDKNIQKMIYSWNTSSERAIKGNGKYLEEEIDVPAGDNVLHIKVIDENGNETVSEEEISSENGVDILNPVIDLEVIDGEKIKKLKITVTDETSLDFMTYRWNESDEETIYAEEGSKEIVTEIDILKGENDLTVVAVDGSSNTTTETKSFLGVTKPEIKVTLSEDGSSIIINAVHEKGIKEVKYNFNNQDYNVDIGDETPTQIEFPQKLDVGYNRIILTVTSVDGTDTTFDGECTYGNAESSNNSSNDNNSSSSSEENESSTESDNE